MGNNIWHKATQESNGEWRIYYINCWHNVQRYSIDEMREEQLFNPSIKWEDVVKYCAILRWAYEGSFIESTYNYSRLTK